VIGCDPIVTANKSTLVVMREGRTFVAMNTHGTPTAAFVDRPELAFPGRELRHRGADAAGAGNVGTLDA